MDRLHDVHGMDNEVLAGHLLDYLLPVLNAMSEPKSKGAHGVRKPRDEVGRQDDIEVWNGPGPSKMKPSAKRIPSVSDTRGA